MRIVMMGLILLALLWAVTCDLPGKDLTLKIQGVVTDASNGNPIADAGVVLKEIIWLEGERDITNTTTDSDGYYELRHTFSHIDECSEENLVIYVSSSGYFIGMCSPNSENSVRCVWDEQEIDFRLIKIGTEN